MSLFNNKLSKVPLGMLDQDVQDKFTGYDTSLAQRTSDLNDRAINVMKPPSPSLAPYKDGTNDDAPRLNSIFANSVSKIVWLPSGTYQIESGLVLPSNITVMCDVNVEIRLKAGINNVDMISNSDKVGGNTNIQWIGGKINGNVTTNKSLYKVGGIIFLNVTNAVIENVEALNCTTSNTGTAYKNSAVWLGKCTRSLVKRLISHDNYQCGLQFSGEIAGANTGWNGYNMVEKSHFYSNGCSAIDISGGENYDIINSCEAVDNGLVDTASSHFTINCAYNKISDCISRMTTTPTTGWHYNLGHSLATFGVGVQAPNCNVTDCKAYGGKNGINVTSSDYAIVSDCEITDVDTIPLQMSETSYSTVSNVTILRGGSFEQVRVSSNSLFNAIKDCMLINSKRGAVRVDSGCEHTEVRGCKIVDINSTNDQGNGLNAIQMQANNSRVMDNTIINKNLFNATIAVLVTSGTKGHIIDGNVISNFPTPISVLGSRNHFRGTNIIDGRMVCREEMYFEVKENGKQNKVFFSAGLSLTEGSYESGDLIINAQPSNGNPQFKSVQFGGTVGTLSSVTGSMTTGQNILTVNDASNLYVNDFISVAGVTGTLKITKIVGNTVTVNNNANATVSGAAVSYVAPTLTNSSAVL